MLIMAFACDEEGSQLKLKKDVAEVSIQPLSSSSFVLAYEDAGADFETISWEAPDFGFDASVTYVVEVDKAGSNFSNAIELTTTTHPSATVTVGELNAALLALGIEPENAGDIEVRVRSSINPAVEPLLSSVLSLSITPFTTTFPPIYIIGDAQGWDLGSALELQSTGPGTYEAVGIFQENGYFRLFDTPSWSAEQWGFSFFETVDTELINGNDGDSNFIFGASTGYYKVSVSLTEKTITIEPASAPDMYIVGDAQGWDLNNALQMKSLGGGQFEVTGQFQNNGKFRFFVSPSWTAEQYRYSYFASGTIDSELGDGADSDSNFVFTAATGIYKVLISLNDKTISVTTAEEPQLYIIGEDQSWTLANAFKLTWLGGGKYEGSTTFSNNATFRLFNNPDWSGGFGNYLYFEEGEVSPLLENANDNDSNFRFVGTTGTFNFKVDLYNRTVEME
jgi:hypothetical protein